VRDRIALGARHETRAGDFAGYLRRNLSTGYRLVAMALDDPIAAQGVVYDAAMAAWRVGGEWPAPALDRAFRQRLEADCRTALKSIDLETGTPSGATSGEAAVEAIGGQAEPLAAALLSLSPNDRLALAMRYGLAEESPRPRQRWRGGNSLGRSPGVPNRLRARLTEPHVGDGPAETQLLETRLRAIYASRDPGEETPLALRMRLQRGLSDAEIVAAQRDEIARASGWGFAINTFLAVLVLTITVALLSVTDLRASRGAAAYPLGGPTSPLTITSVSVLQSGIDGPGVHVAATVDSLVATFEGSSDWHPEARQCLPDVTGVIDSTGQVQWLGAQAGHVESIAGDPASGSVYASGLGAYCDLGRHSSGDGGNTWAAGPLPPGATGSPPWLAFDPAQPGTLLAAGDGRLFLSRDAGGTWSSSPEMVTPIGFDRQGHLLGWGPGALFESLDDGSSWQQIGAGPATQPTAGAAIPGGVLLGEPDGMWWFPLDVSPSLVQSGTVFSIAPAGDGAVATGSDAHGHPWLGTFSTAARDSAFRVASLPPELASLTVTGGQVAANSSGLVLALSGPSSAIAIGTFAH
jgi:hypothetical protein